MTQTEIEVKLNDHENEIKSLKHRMNKAEKNDETQTEILLTVKELAINMAHMAEEQQKQGARLEKLETAPIDDHKHYKRAMITVAITTVVGGLFGAFMTFIINGGLS